MDKSTFFIQILLVLGGLQLLDAQFPGEEYGRRRFRRPRRFRGPRPRRNRHYPILPPVESYRPIVEPVYPVPGTVPVVGGAPIVSDASQTSSNTVVTNNNVNEDIRTNAGNVFVSQRQAARTDTGRQGCGSACQSDFDCGQQMQCVPGSNGCNQCVPYAIWR